MADCQETDILSLVTTVGSHADAQRLAQSLIERRLAACVQVEPGLVSHYRWNGADCAEPEVRLTIKTLPQCRPALLAFLSEAHPYQLPQLLWQQLQADAAYAAWVRQAVTEPLAG